MNQDMMYEVRKRQPTLNCKVGRVLRLRLASPQAVGKCTGCYYWRNYDCRHPLGDSISVGCGDYTYQLKEYRK